MNVFSFFYQVDSISIQTFMIALLLAATVPRVGRSRLLAVIDIDSFFLLLCFAFHIFHCEVIDGSLSVEC